MGRSLLALFALLLALPGCFEEIPDPTQGFLEVATGGVADVEVLVDGVSQGVTSRVGPLEAGTYAVSVRRAGYEVVPAEQAVEVRPARTARAEFNMTLVFTGAASVEATDELRGTDVAGAEILVDTGSGLVPTGLVTPAVVPGLPPGTVRIVARKTGFEEPLPRTVEIAVAETADVTVALGPPRAVLLEMFTYIICSGCPDAAAKLDEMHRAAPGRVHVIEWHTYPNPSLPLVDPRWQARRNAIYGGGTACPATVIQGGAADDPVVIIGSEPSALDEFERRADAALAACTNDCALALVVDGTIGATAADLTARLKWRSGALPGDLRLRAVLIENHVVAGGFQPYYDFVAREIHEEAVTFAAPGEILERSFAIPVNGAWSVEELGVIAFVQSDATREILAVASLP